MTPAPFANDDRELPESVWPTVDPDERALWGGRITAFGQFWSLYEYQTHLKYGTSLGIGKSVDLVEPLMRITNSYAHDRILRGELRTRINSGITSVPE
jgi:hypothetical protein